MSQKAIDKQDEHITRIQVGRDGSLYKLLEDGSKVAYEEPNQTDWERLARMRDEDIDTSDIPELDEYFWKTAKLVTPKRKVSTTIRLDIEVLDWFRGQGKGWQTRINSVLQTYCKNQQG